MKASAVAHPIQGLIKYHGLKNRRLRIPFHDSISVCSGALQTHTTIEFDSQYREDQIEINGRSANLTDAGRILRVIEPIRRIAKSKQSFKLVSQNSLTTGKGLGFSASAFASVGLSAAAALGVEMDRKSLSATVRLGAGSATRSLAGGFAVWYANRRGSSYAEQLAGPGQLDFQSVIVPIHSNVKTDMAHEDALTSPLFKARLLYVEDALGGMRRAIIHGDTRTVCELAERDTLNLHAIAMTGTAELILFSPETVMLLNLIKDLRINQDMPVWFSVDTGPSVFANTTKDYVSAVAKTIREETGLQTIRTDVGDEARLTEKHLF